VREEYVVQRGDTLYGIAKEFDTSVQKLIEINGLVDNFIYPGQVLIILENGESTPYEIIAYVVGSGDSLYSIARKYNSSVDEIKRYNNLTNDNLFIGQKLNVPVWNMNEDVSNNYISYTVEKGDNLYSIARRFGTSVDKIKKDNNLNNELLSVGDILLIYDNNVSNETDSDECFGSDFNVPSNNVIYTVQKGDSLYNIAKKFNTSVSLIKDANNLNTDLLSIGQELKIPVTNGNGNSNYIVQKGESLYSIAKKFNTTVNEIKRKNNLTNNLLSIGQELII